MAGIRYVSGIVRAKTSISAPFSGKPSVAYRARLAWWRRVFRRKRGHEQAGTPFYLLVEATAENPSGRYLVDSRGAELCIPDRRFSLPNNDSRVVDFHKRLGRRNPHGPTNVLERSLGTGDQVEVCGEETWVPDPQGSVGSYREPPLLVVLRARSIRLVKGTVRKIGNFSGEPSV